MSRAATTPDHPETIVYLPGIACRVHVSVTDAKFRDRLQQAVMALMRAPAPAEVQAVTAKKLAEDLCVQTPIIESVLLALEQEDLVRSTDGLFTLVDHSPNAGLLRDTTGWMFWNSLQQEFLPCLVMDEDDLGLPGNGAPESALAESQSRQEGIPYGAMLDAARHPDFTIGRLAANRTITTANEFQVRSISRENRRFGFPLAAMAQMRPRFGGLPATFLHAARPYPDWPAEVEFAPHLAGLIQEALPQVHEQLRQEAAEVQRQFLRENCAEFLAKLGGETVVRQEARQRVTTELAGVKMSPAFLTPALESAASDAELNYILFQHDESLISEASVRRDFATVLQGVGCIVADLSADALKCRDLLDALNRQLDQQLSGLDEFGRKRYWRQQLDELGRRLRCDFRAWTEISAQLRNLDNFFKTAHSVTSRHTLGKAFTCWCAVPLLGGTSQTAQKHLRWMHAAISSLSNLPEVYGDLKETRNEDKSVRANEAVMPLEEFRSKVYALWRALGRDWR